MIHILTLTALVALASAEPEDPNLAQAKAHAMAARKLYGAKRYKEALKEFTAAYQLKPKSALWFNIGKCYEQSGEVPQALRSYRQYLREDPSTKDRKEVEKAISDMERRLKGRGVQQLLVLTEPTGVDVAVDRKPVGPSPASIELRPGPTR